jgi:hypothetical protein
MAEPIYKFFTVRFLEAWYQLSEEEQNGLEGKLDTALGSVGAKRLILCDSRWSTDEWAFAGVEEFPNIEAAQKYTAALNELNWFRYVEGRNVLGIKLEE